MTFEPGLVARNGVGLFYSEKHAGQSQTNKRNIKQLPSSFMPTSRHFWNRQYGHRFLWVLSIIHDWFSRHTYLLRFCTVRLKKPTRTHKMWSSRKNYASVYFLHITTTDLYNVTSINADRIQVKFSVTLHIQASNRILILVLCISCHWSALWQHPHLCYHSASLFHKSHMEDIIWSHHSHTDQHLLIKKSRSKQMMDRQNFDNKDLACILHCAVNNTNIVQYNNRDQRTPLHPTIKINNIQNLCSFRRSAGHSDILTLGQSRLDTHQQGRHWQQ